MAAAPNDGRRLPAGYIPFEVLDLCSNQLENVPIILEIGTHVPLLVGRGEYPMVWLTLPRLTAIPVPITDVEWIDAVVGDRVADGLSEPLKSLLRLERRPTPVPTVEVWSGASPVLRVRREDQQVGKIDFIDLRSLGLAITGSSNDLSIGGNHMTRNHFSNMRVMMKIG